MNWISTGPMPWLERYLDLAAYRHGVIAGNLANIDTPDYAARDIDFQRELDAALRQASPAQGPPVVRNVPDLVARPDGNNVSLERETALLAQTQIQFQIGTQLLRAQFRRLQTAIREGREL